MSTAVYDKADQMVELVTPKDEAADPVCKATPATTRSATCARSPSRWATCRARPATTRRRGTNDAIYQPVEVVDAVGGKATATYDNVGNVTTFVDARKSATTDPADYTTKFEYDRVHRVVKTTDAIGKVHLVPVRPRRAAPRADGRRR